MLITAESVSPSHPDKLCDQISDAILDECFKQDPNSRVAIETMGGHGIITVTGELTTKAYVDIREIAQSIVGTKYGVQNNIVKQSPEIAQGVDIGGAGDQGIMNGYACNDNVSLIPHELYLARDLCKYIYTRYPYDGKTQVTINDIDNSINTIVASFQNVSKKDLLSRVKEFMGSDTLPLIHCNPAGDWSQGGFEADTGVTGRKLAVDNYGPSIPIGGGAFCVDGKTEFLSESGWKKLDKYEKGDLVGQYTEDGNMELIDPLDYISEPCEKMFEINGETNISQALTGNHNFVYLSSKGNLNKKPFIEVKKQHEESELGFSGRVIPFFNWEGGDGVELTDEEIRLQIAFMADGTLKHQNRVRLLKKEKIQRLQQLLEEAQYDYEIRHYADGYTYFYFNPPIETKIFDFEYWGKATLEQLKIIAKEVVMWDGNRENIYRTTRKENADFIQLVFTIVYQSKCSILIDDRVGEEYSDKYIRKSICYDVCSNKTKYETLKRKSGNKLEIKEIEPENRMKYCFTVPSGMLVLRRNDRIFVTGNSGKDPSKVDRSGAYMARYIAVDLLRKEKADQVFVQVAYAIGVAEPVQAIATIQKNGDKKRIIIEGYDLTPNGIIQFLDLRKPQYLETAKWGHFGGGFSWDNI